MSQMTDIFENHVLNVAFAKSSSFTPPATMFVGLFKGNPTDTGSLVSEVTGGGYARVTVTALMGTATTGYINNITDILFAQATVAWGDITHIGILTTSTLSAGDMVVYASLAATVTINANEQFRINASNVTFQAL